MDIKTVGPHTRFMESHVPQITYAAAIAMRQEVR